MRTFPPGVRKLDSRSRVEESWIVRAHALDDDLTCSDGELLSSLADIVRDWPTTNVVVRAALDKASLELIALAELAQH